MVKWFNTKSFSNFSRINGCTKIANHQLNLLNRAVYHNRDLTAKKFKFMFYLDVSVRSFQRYINIMGWVKIKTKYCQAVSLKNEKEWIVFATMAKSLKDTFHNSIFIDESIVTVMIISLSNILNYLMNYLVGLLRLLFAKFCSQNRAW